MQILKLILNRRYIMNNNDIFSINYTEQFGESYLIKEKVKNHEQL